MIAKHLLATVVLTCSLILSLSPCVSADTNEVLRLTAAMKAVGNATYGLTGGYLTVSGLVPIGPHGCIVPGGVAGAIGVLDVTVDGGNYTVLVPIAKLNIIRLLGTTVTE